VLTNAASAARPRATAIARHLDLPVREAQ